MIEKETIRRTVGLLCLAGVLPMANLGCQPASHSSSPSTTNKTTSSKPDSKPSQQPKPDVGP